MKILYLVSDNERSDVTDHAADICRAFRSEGHDVTAMVKKNRTAASLFRKFLIPAIPLPFGGLFDFKTPIEISKAIGNRGAVMIIVNSMSDADLASKAMKLASNPEARIVLILPWANAEKRMAGGSIACRALSAVIVYTQHHKEEFLKLFPEFDSRKLHVIAPGAVITKRDRNADCDEKTLLYMGKITPDCGLSTVIEAMGRIHRRRIGLIVAGKGSGRSVMPLIRRARALGIDSRIKWAGNDYDTDELLSEADVGIMPHATDMHPIMSMVKYFANGMPVIATKIPMHMEMATHGVEGMFVEPSDTEKMAECLESLSKDKKLSSEYAENAQAAAVERYSFPAFYNRLSTLLASLATY